MADTGSMAGKTVLVTGGTGGIGRAAAIGLARMGARVGITGRDRARADDAAAAITRETGNPAVDIFVADMSSQAEVRRLAGEVLAAYPRLDVLLNNVGGFWAHRHVTADGLEHTFALNHLAPFLLTNLLLDRLIASAPARVVTVSSGAHSTGKIDFDDLMGERSYSGSARLQPVEARQRDVHLRARQATRGDRRHRQCPASRLDQHRVRRRGPGRSVPLVRLMRPFMRSPAKGADTAVYLASCARGRGRHRPVLRRPQGQEVEQGLLRHRGRRPAVAGQRRSGRDRGSTRPAETARRRDYGIGRQAWPRRIASADQQRPRAPTKATLISVDLVLRDQVGRQARRRPRRARRRSRPGSRCRRSRPRPPSASPRRCRAGTRRRLRHRRRRSRRTPRVELSAGSLPTNCGAAARARRRGRRSRTRWCRRGRRGGRLLRGLDRLGPGVARAVGQQDDDGRGVRAVRDRRRCAAVGRIVLGLARRDVRVDLGDRIDATRGSRCRSPCGARSSGCATTSSRTSWSVVGDWTISAKPANATMPIWVLDPGAR